MRRLLAACVVVFAVCEVDAQSPAADWRTVTTPHFRLHYPRQYETWSLRAASRLESIRAAVVREIGYAPDTVTDVVVANPIAQPNGMAWPFLDAPRIVFFTEPPGPDEQIGSYTNWIDLLAVHEVAHIVHMLRPSRNPMVRLVERYVLPLNRITFGAPRWVLEGYATVIEGRLTGAGRPSSTVRALILRQWAAHGRLPSYEQLDSDSRFLGMSMAYLAGSAYLEWLEQRSGPESLRHVWTRMTARHRRSFDEAFEGVFGESPERLYGQFVAELTASAMAANRAAPMREGELWQETTRASGDPAVSPDGSRIAVVVRARDKPAKLVVWSTGPAEKEEKEYEERLTEIRQRDPEDVLPVRAKPLPRDPLHTFTPPDGGGLLTPRWMPDGRSILYAHRQPDADGFLHHDLFVWTPETGANTRVTHLADVREADPLPDGKSAIAIHSRYGLSQLVVVDLSTGDIRTLTEPSLDVVYSHPRVSPDGQRLAYVMNRSGTWALIVRDLATGAESVINPDDADAFAWPEWTRDGKSLLITLFARGFAELYRVDPRDGRRVPITRTSGGATQPAPSSDGRVFFMSLQPDGFVVRVIDDAEAAAAPPFDAAWVPAVPPRPAAATAFAVESLPTPRPYGVGGQEVASLFGGNFAPSQNSTEIGIRLGDVIGRLDTIAVASFGSKDAQRGVGVASAWRGWPIDIAGHIFRSEDRHGDRDGVELRAMWDRQAPRARLAIEGGILGGSPVDLGFAEAQFDLWRVSSSWRVSQRLIAGYETGSFQQIRGSFAASIERGSTSLSILLDRRRLTDAGNSDELMQLGGLPSTIIPRSAFSNRVFDPALPVRTLSGDDYFGGRVGATIPGIPLSLFYQHHRLNRTDIEIAGGEIVVSSEPMPLIRIPGLDATIGVARILSGPIERDTNWWIGLRWRP